MPPRSLLTLIVALGLPLLVGACGVPIAVTASSYGADGGLALATDKTSTDHLISMASKRDCSIWRVFRHQAVCKDRTAGKDPYQVDYEEPFNMGPDGYAPPLRAAAGAPAHSWDAAVYKPAAPAPTEPVLATAQGAPAPDVSATPVPATMPPQASAEPPASPVPHKKKAAARAKAKKPSPGQVASAH